MATNTRRSLLVDGTQGSQLKYGGGNLPGRDQQHEVSGPPQAVYSRLSSQDLLERLTPGWQRRFVSCNDPRQDPSSLCVAVSPLHHFIGELIQPLHVLGVGKLAVVEYDLVSELLGWAGAGLRVPVSHDRTGTEEDHLSHQQQLGTGSPRWA